MSMPAATVQDCIFCRIVRREIQATIVHEDEDFLAFRDVNPQAPVHDLVIPKRHVARAAEFEERDTALAGALILRGTALARKEGLDAGGYRLVLNNGADGGQTVFHVHLHVLGGRPMAWPPG